MSLITTTLEMEDIPVGTDVMVQGGYSFDSVYRARVISHICAGIIEIRWLDRGDKVKVSVQKVLAKVEPGEQPTFSKRQRRQPRRLVETKENKAKKRYIAQCTRPKEEPNFKKVPRIRIKIVKPEEPLPKIVRRKHDREPTTIAAPTTIEAIIRNINFVSSNNCEEEEGDSSDAEESSLQTQETNISQKFQEYEHLLLERES
jgi:hypothetical protein